MAIYNRWIYWRIELKNESTDFFPFFLLYNKHRILLIDFRGDLMEYQQEDDDLYNIDTF